MIITKHLSGTVIYSVTEKKPLDSAEVTESSTMKATILCKGFKKVNMGNHFWKSWSIQSCFCLNEKLLFTLMVYFLYTVSYKQSSPVEDFCTVLH